MEGNDRNPRASGGIENISATDSDALREQLKFWMEELAGELPVLRLPTDRPRPAVQGTSREILRFDFPAELNQPLRACARKIGVEPQVVLIGAWAVLMSRWSGQEDLVIGTDIGIALRTRLQADDTVEHLVRQVGRKLTECKRNRQISFSRVLEAVVRNRDPSHAPIFQTSVVVSDLNIPIESIANPAPSDLDLSLNLTLRNDEMSGSVVYASQLFATTTIERLTAQLKVVVRAMVLGTDVPISHLDVLTAQERELLLHEFNCNSAPYPPDTLIHELFEAQVIRTPNAIGVVFEEEEITYAEINARADQVANYLRSAGAKPDSIVGICMQRSIEMVVGLMGILKSGAAYMPIDPNYPDQRLRYILNDAAPAIVLTQENLLDKLSFYVGKVIPLDSAWDAISTSDACNVDRNVTRLSSRNLAYVIYTSGSTGNPKGAMNEHHGVVNRLRWMQDQYHLTDEDRVLQKTPFSFDVSVWEFFWTLMSGARLIVAKPEGHQDPAYLRDLIDAKQVTTLHFVPSMLQSFLDAIQAGANRSLRHVVCSGEELTVNLNRRFNEILPHARLSNLYGPTEAAVDVTSWECSSSAPTARVPIGRPISNVRMYVLDRFLQPAPLGVTGDIYIGGTGVGRGYWNRPALTAERFVADPFADDSRYRLYQTGDLGRWRPDGALEYAGRRDHQVKLRGFRIELGEIESRLIAMRQVKDAVVIAREDAPGDRRLVAYIIPNGPQAAERASEAASTNDLVGQWQSIYDDAYAALPSAHGPNFAGWNSSYTGMPIPLEEMEEWLSNTVSRIRALHPRKLLEVGCGVGLLVKELAPHCELYTATDLSPVAVRDLRLWLQDQKHMQHVHVQQGDAAQLGEFGNDAFDTVVLNSVAQHFPDAGYLVSFIEEAANVVCPGGRIFIGDIRNLDTLELFHTSVQVAKASADTTLKQMRSRVRVSVDQERQLVIAPEFFRSIANIIPKVTGIEINLKRGKHRNELTDYRYDVVLYLGQQSVVADENIERKYTGSRSLEAVRDDLARRSSGRIALLGVENARLSADYHAQRLIAQRPEHSRLQSIRGDLERQVATGIDPELFWDLGERHGFNTRISWGDSGNSGTFDVFFADRKLGDGALIETPNKTEISSNPHRGALPVNDPNAHRLRTRLVADIREDLKRFLPDYMIPGAFVLLDSLPVSPNGKLDRSALPVPEAGAYASQQYEPPVGDLEQLLAEIWQSVLRVEHVGRQDNFFELGGHSLHIVQVIEQLRRVGLTAELRHIFDNPQLCSLANSLDSASRVENIPANLIPDGCAEIEPSMLALVRLKPEEIQKITAAVPGGARNIQDIYPLTPAQQGILFHHLRDAQHSDPYVTVTLLECQTGSQLNALAAALQTVVDRHDALRTSIHWESTAAPVQVVVRHAPLHIEELQLDPHLDSIAQLKDRMRPELQGLNLRRAPLMRFQIAKGLSGGRCYGLLHLHHLVTDNSSLQTLIEEARAFVAGDAAALETPTAFRSHVFRTLASKSDADGEKLFRNMLSSIDGSTLPFGLSNVHGDGSRLREDSLSIDPELGVRVRTVARRLGVSPATLFHSTWGLVASTTSCRDDIVFGTVVLGRFSATPENQNTMGMFINTLPMRLRLDNLTAADLVQETNRVLASLLGCESVSLAVAQRCSGISGAAPLFSSVINYRRGLPAASAWARIAGVRMISAQNWTNYPVSISVDDSEDNFLIAVQADQDIDPARIVAYVKTALESLIHALEYEPTAPARELKVLPRSEWQAVTALFCHSPQPYPRGNVLHQLFEDQVTRTPDTVAVVSGNDSLTYRELNRRANQLARYMRDRGALTEQLVGLCVERGVELLVGIMGILKAGAAYVPFDPNYPPERLALMLKHAQPPIILTQVELLERLPKHSAMRISLDGDWTEIAKESDLNLDPMEVGVSSRNLAYVIYTSGSTGEPKGVMVEHSGAVNLAFDLEHRFHEPFDCRRIGMNASFSFDSSVNPLLQLLCGCTLYPIPQALRMDAPALLDFLNEKAIEGVDCTPSQLQTWISAGLLDRANESPLRTVIIGGEVVDTPLWNNLTRCSQITFYNDYGPTEGTVECTAASSRDGSVTSHIGRPIGNARVYILDGHMRPVPIGAVGEIYIGGAGVARGYLNRPEVTAERFLADPLIQGASARVYKTGDLGRWRADGAMEYVGRNDRQVKIRGFRIELGEIEAQLQRHPQVREAAVLVREDIPGIRRLVAYVTLSSRVDDADSILGINELRAHTTAVLPLYMVPSAFVILDKMPLTAGAKLDQRALPAPDSNSYHTGRYEAPRGDIEEQLAAIWSQTLGATRVGRSDDFFELGGHSLLVMKLTVAIADRLGVRLPVQAVFQYPTMTEMAGHVASLLELEEFVV